MSKVGDNVRVLDAAKAAVEPRLPARVHIALTDIAEVAPEGLLALSSI